MKQDLPSFFKDESESMKFEEVIDFFMSWTIRCAETIYQNDHKIINDYAKLILSKLIFGDENHIGDKNISSLKIWKQHWNVDLWVELEIDSKEIALIIEHKMYSSIREGQLEKYKNLAEEYYKERKEIQLFFIFLRPDYEIDLKYGEKVNCEKLGYLYLNLEELQCVLPEQKTGNDLFDEFWFNWK